MIIGQIRGKIMNYIKKLNLIASLKNKGATLAEIKFLLKILG
jgi:hypothetical protein